MWDIVLCSDWTGAVIKPIQIHSLVHKVVVKKSDAMTHACSLFRLFVLGMLGRSLAKLLEDLIPRIWPAKEGSLTLRRWAKHMLVLHTNSSQCWWEFHYFAHIRSPNNFLVNLDVITTLHGKLRDIKVIADRRIWMLLSYLMLLRHFSQNQKMWAS